MHDLTVRQKEVLKAIDTYIREQSHPPAVRDIGKMLDIKSSSTVSGYLNKLRDKGYVDWKEGQPRTLRILKTAS